jgi:hypothetical protein
MSITHNGEDSPTTVNLMGAGGIPGIAISPSSFDFGNVSIGNSSSMGTRIINNRSEPFVISSVAVNGDRFEQYHQTPITILPGNNYWLDVSFRPTTPGVHTGTATITHNASDSPYTIILTGNAPAPPSGSAIEVNSTSLNFYDAGLGSYGRYGVNIISIGTQPLEIERIDFDGEGFSLSGNYSFPMTINAGTNTSFSFRFLPARTGSHAGTAKIYHKAANLPSPIEISLIGYGVPSIATISPASLDFGTVDVGSSSEKSLRMTNIGTYTLDIYSISSSNNSFIFENNQFNLF